MELSRLLGENVTVFIDRLQDRIAHKLPQSAPNSPVRSRPSGFGARSSMPNSPVRHSPGGSGTRFSTTARTSHDNDHKPRPDSPLRRRVPTNFSRDVSSNSSSLSSRRYPLVSWGKSKSIPVSASSGRPHYLHGRRAGAALPPPANARDKAMAFLLSTAQGRKKEDAREGFIRQRSWTTDSETSWASRDSSSVTSTPDASPMPSPMSKEFRHEFPSPPSSPGPIRSRSFTLDSPGSLYSQPPATPDGGGGRRDVNHNHTTNSITAASGALSPIKTMFLMATNQPRDSPLPSPLVSSPMEEQALLASPRRPSGSWRKVIFNRVCTPQHSLEIGEDPEGRLGSGEEIRAMWKKAILETLLLIRMEKENHSVRARQEEGGATLSRKLDYEELTPCLKEITTIWEELMALHDREETGQEGGGAIPHSKLLECVQTGVPRSLRGQIWLFLMQQRQMSTTVPEGAMDGSKYDDLLKQLTMHQHAILIDLGRTFPCHPYFSKALGPGQLELFNLLKAYSLLDTEVGYCQGLSFIVGTLLMHMEEISAFHVLKYMMFDLGLRRQFRPNMMALQIKLYQLTRLLHDHYKDVYDHLERYEISPTLYAAPWFLTLFASQFPLGFVARVFDMLFVQGIDALFKVALTLLGNHRALILQCDSFESTVDFLKTTLPEMVQVQMERVINQAFELDIDQQLQAYEVEYHVLSEEMAFASQHNHRQHHSHHQSVDERPTRPLNRRSSIDFEMLFRLEQQNQGLKQQNLELLEKLQNCQSQQRSYEHSVHAGKIEQDKLKSHIRTLELERAALLTAVVKLRKLVPREALQSLNLSLPQLPPSTPSPTTSHSEFPVSDVPNTLSKSQGDDPDVPSLPEDTNSSLQNQHSFNQLPRNAWSGQNASSSRVPLSCNEGDGGPEKSNREFNSDPEEGLSTSSTTSPTPSVSSSSSSRDCKPLNNNSSASSTTTSTSSICLSDPAPSSPHSELGRNLQTKTHKL